MRNRLEELTRETWSCVEIHGGSPIPGNILSRWKKVEPAIREESDLVITTTGTSHGEVRAFAQLKAPGQDDSVLNSLPYIIKQTLLELKDVEAVYFNFNLEQMVVDVWTILSDPSEVNRRAVYEKELTLIDAFPTLTFSFRTSDRAGEASPASSDYHRLSKKY